MQRVTCLCLNVSPALAGLALLVLTCFTGSGCKSIQETFGKSEEEKAIRHVVGIYQIARTGVITGKLTKSVPDTNGEMVVLRRFPLISSRSFVYMKIDNESNPPAIKVYLDSHGKFLWMQTCVEHVGIPVAVTIDNIYRFSMRVPQLSGDSACLILPGPWEPKEAENIISWAKKNYENLSGN